MCKLRRLIHKLYVNPFGLIFLLYSVCELFARVYISINIKSEMRSFKSKENIHKKEGRSYYVVSANKASSVTL